MSRDILAPCRLCGRPNPWRLHRALHRWVVFGLAEQDGLRRCPAFGPRPVRGAGLCIQVAEYLRQLLPALHYLLHPCSRLDDGRVFDAGDDLYDAAAVATGFNVDVEDSLQTLRPSHGRAAFGGRWVWRVRRFGLVAAAPARHHLHAKVAVRGKSTVKSGVARTASYAQVNQPLYRSSQERWWPYRKHL
jgi:hypothetical protein